MTSPRERKRIIIWGFFMTCQLNIKTISIVGMAKNAGKTTALNYLIEEAIDEGVLLGITSTGRDGEMQDLVTGTEKPRVYLDQDMLGRRTISSL